ncbi:hypothetical protein [Nonomuraea zeae]|uniref:Uncharacterized protein n=1 Tax=Nonomuraea zeae TaxID=1642303 RepID=A0A5S4FZI3_9ACTN|nr:hypothetical protein [Nonomuraea zeae]TMR26109.1 hypothetical protein ETD85_43620 [Nonomuraea zeae]
MRSDAIHGHLSAFPGDNIGNPAEKVRETSPADDIEDSGVGESGDNVEFPISGRRDRPRAAGRNG